MKTLTLLSSLVILSTLFTACGESTDTQEKYSQTALYIQDLENENNISYGEIINTRGAYITSMCYTETQDNVSGTISNPCYSCHTKGKTPNYYNDTNLQENYNFPKDVMKNPFSNLFKDRTLAVSKITDSEILEYIRESNYFDVDGNIILQSLLPQDWQGYKPDCYYNFDADGMDRKPNGEYTLWRAFRYYPFLGTFWPTNGSTDDVLIRLDEQFSQDENGTFDMAVYKLNLSIVESLVKHKDIELFIPVDESLYGVDLNQNDVLDLASKIVLSTYDKMSYVGKAKLSLAQGGLHLAPGLFPEGTEFLHSVRYVDWDDAKNHIGMSKRMKELRYAKKYAWSTYSDINRVANTELKEALANGSDETFIALFRGDYEKGLDNQISWKYQGFIEDRSGELRPQTHEETIACMGCHSHLGATTDSIFSFARKLEGVDNSLHDFGWNHWTQKGLAGLSEPKVTYNSYGEEYEYSFYLNNNHSGNEFRNNSEVQEKFFDANATLRPDAITRLHSDISELLFPSKERALGLNKGYKAMVEEQSYIYGRDANVAPMNNVLRDVEAGKMTQIANTIVRVSD